MLRTSVGKCGSGFATNATALLVFSVDMTFVLSTDLGGAEEGDAGDSLHPL